MATNGTLNLGLYNSVKAGVAIACLLFAALVCCIQCRFLALSPEPKSWWNAKPTPTCELALPPPPAPLYASEEVCRWVAVRGPMNSVIVNSLHRRAVSGVWPR